MRVTTETIRRGGGSCQPRPTARASRLWTCDDVGARLFAGGKMSRSAVEKVRKWESGKKHAALHNSLLLAFMNRTGCVSRRALRSPPIGLGQQRHWMRHAQGQAAHPRAVDELQE